MPPSSHGLLLGDTDRTNLYDMVRKMKAIIMHIESVVTPSGNSGHVVVPKAWIEKEAYFFLTRTAMNAAVHVYRLGYVCQECDLFLVTK
jgi:putative transposon-encoded protein